MHAKEITYAGEGLAQLFPREVQIVPGYPYVRFTSEDTGKVLGRNALAGLRVKVDGVHTPEHLCSMIGAVRAARRMQLPELRHNEQVMGLCGIHSGHAIVRPQYYSDFLETNGSSGFTPDMTVDRYLAEALSQHWRAAGVPVNRAMLDLLTKTSQGFPGFSAGIGAHTLGVAALMQTSDGWYLPVARDPAHVGVNTQGLNVGPAGGVLWTEPVGGERLADRLRLALEDEAVEEFGLLPHDYIATFLGGTRELARGGSPEFFFLMSLRMSLAEFAMHYVRFTGKGKSEARHVTPMRLRRLASGVGIHPKAQVAVQLLRELQAGV